MTTTDGIRLARVALSLLVEPGNRSLWRQVADHGPVPALDQLLAAEHENRMKRRPWLPLDAPDVRQLADGTLTRTQRIGARVVIPEDEEWPQQLDDLIGICDPGGPAFADRDAAPPLCLWVRGQRPLDETLDRSVAVIGTRAASDDGERMARRLGYELASRNWTVVSGGGQGIDQAAHQGSLAGGGATVAMLPCGVDAVHPVGQASLLQRIAEDGLLVSEWPPEAQPFRYRILARGLITAATRGMVAIEAAACGTAQRWLHRASQLGRFGVVMLRNQGTAVEDTSDPAAMRPATAVKQNPSDSGDACRTAGTRPTAARDTGAGGAR